MGIEDIRDALVIRERSSFLLTDTQGNAPRGNAQGFGLYHADTRHLSAYEFSLNGAEPVMLLSTAELGYAMEQVMTNRTMMSHNSRRIARGSIELRRQRTVADVLEERLRISNFNPFPVTLALRYEFEADFADIFDVRGYERARHGTPHPPEMRERSIRYRYTGIDGRERDTTIAADTTPIAMDAGSMLFRVTLQRRESVTLRLTISVDGEQRDPSGVSRFDMVAEDYRRWGATATQILTDNEFFNRVIQRSLSDVRMLWGENEEGDAYPAAGTPWFDALFGRDSCIVSMQMLAYRPELARSTLRLLAKWQGTKLDPTHDEEPGKILHELRFDELSRAGELPYGPYYGSIDSTPLFLMAFAEHYAWTADLKLARELMPAVRAALTWMDTYGDVTGGGYLAYEKHSQKGLVNQGWKDSYDAVVHADGALATPPIALAEAQAYAYAARRRLAPILERLGEKGLAASNRERAEALRRRFNEDFWLEDQRFFAMALDGQRHPVASIATNPAHGLWCGIIDPARAGEVTGRLMQHDVFSGWGLRTLASGSPRFNPIGYHVGSVWPHDNSIAAMGFKMYGFEDELNELASALFDAATSFPNFRLPELFGGEVRSAHNTPVPYPVACRPQSWAAGALPLITQAILGLKAEAPEKRLRIVNPRLPYWLNSVHVRGLRVGNGHVTLHYRRGPGGTHVEVQKATAGIEVVVSNRWPL
ncbi:MAG TPA: glycogen debranching N-terminal domain-containing protein [Dehalococcoidia bacterium]|nr:glycogen debranching N-terminal domain-containing protein [Dehalococcoidia bacterium]